MTTLTFRGTKYKAFTTLTEDEVSQALASLTTQERIWLKTMGALPLREIYIRGYKSTLMYLVKRRSRHQFRYRQGYEESLDFR